MERDRRSFVAAAALLSVCTLASVVHVVEANIFSGKTFLKTQQDCVQFLGINPLRLSQYKKYVYPPDRDTMCLIRCIGISLDFWDDTQGFNVSMVEQEFSPLVDASFKQQLADSITSKLELLDPLDNCSRAFYAFRTFRAQLRQLLSLGTSTLSPNANFEPLTAVQILNNIVDCAREVNLPKVFLTSLSKGIIADCPEVRCLIRCAAIRSRFYTDQDGALLQNLHRHFDPPGEDLASFTLRQNLCLQRNQQSTSCDPCTRAYRQFFVCLRPDFEQFFIKNINNVMQHPIFENEQAVEANSVLSPSANNRLDAFSLNKDALLSSY
uniref:Uncharacterized protein n=1 Tax=Anopheles farauti TaxID=69004 RepID=A0A182QDX8_9DIPT